MSFDAEEKRDSEGRWTKLKGKLESAADNPARHSLDSATSSADYSSMYRGRDMLRGKHRAAMNSALEGSGYQIRPREKSEYLYREGDKPVTKTRYSQGSDKMITTRRVREHWVGDWTSSPSLIVEAIKKRESGQDSALLGNHGHPSGGHAGHGQ